MVLSAGDRAENKTNEELSRGEEKDNKQTNRKEKCEMAVKC